MKKYFSLLVFTAAIFSAGCCNKKKNKATTPKTEIIVKQLAQEKEQAIDIDTDRKEDYSIIA